MLKKAIAIFLSMCIIFTSIPVETNAETKSGELKKILTETLWEVLFVKDSSGKHADLDKVFGDRSKMNTLRFYDDQSQFAGMYGLVLNNYTNSEMGGQRWGEYVCSGNTVFLYPEVSGDVLRLQYSETNYYGTAVETLSWTDSITDCDGETAQYTIYFASKIDVGILTYDNNPQLISALIADTWEVYCTYDFFSGELTWPEDAYGQGMFKKNYLNFYENGTFTWCLNEFTKSYNNGVMTGTYLCDGNKVTLYSDSSIEVFNMKYTPIDYQDFNDMSLYWIDEYAYEVYFVTPDFYTSDYIINFDLNGGTSSFPLNQTAEKDSLIAEPENPVRNGYIFCGWYSNKECTGTEWFNVYNSYKGYPVTSDMTLYAKWKKSFEDGYQFPHSGTSFFENYNKITRLFCNYKLSGDYYDILLRDESLLDKGGLIYDMTSVWNGSCFGLACVAALVHSEKLDPDFFQSGAECLHDLDYPKDNETIWNLINYYYLIQNTKSVRDARKKWNTVQDVCKDIINELNESQYPVVVEISYSGGRHALVAYDYNETATDYLVRCYDVNDSAEDVIITINKNDYSWSIDTVGYQKNLKICAVFTVEEDSFDHKNIQEELIKLGHKSGAEGLSLQYAAEPQEENICLTTNYDSFMIQCSNGKQAVIESGEVTEGDLEISEPLYMNSEGEDTRIQFIVPLLEAGEYYEIILTDELSEYQTSFSGGKKYSNVTCDGIASIIFYSDGSVMTDADEDISQKVTLGNDNIEVPWLLTSVESFTTNINVGIENDKLNISLVSGDDFAVEVMDEYDTASFDYVNNQSSSYSLSADAEGKIVLINNETLGIEQTEMGNALIFYSMGGSLIDAQSNIAAGDTAEKPTDPTRAGFVFEGWYTEPTCSDGNEWSFDSPITEDTRVYAKWSEDDDHMHEVKFRCEGEEETIIVFDGESLTEEQIPEVPYKEGYIGKWNAADFTNIFSDMTVYAEYDLAGVHRLAGPTRYETAFVTAEALKTEMGAEKVHSIIITCGTNFPDALSGTYLAAKADAPIILTNTKNEKKVITYVKDNLVKGGTVYLLGDSGVVPNSIEKKLSGYKVIRLGGTTRYETNLEILRAAGVSGKDILVCTGSSYADSLSAAATGLPILIVKDKLNSAQKKFLETIDGDIYVIGGTSAVNTYVENELKIYGSVKRIGGLDRHETSVLIAKEFFKNPEAAVLAYSKNFPDGLCGGALAYYIKAPLILTMTGKEKSAVAYTVNEGIEKGYVLGSEELISDDSANKILYAVR